MYINKHIHLFLCRCSRRTRRSTRRSFCRSNCCAWGKWTATAWSRGGKGSQGAGGVQPGGALGSSSWQLLLVDQKSVLVDPTDPTDPMGKFNHDFPQQLHCLTYRLKSNTRVLVTVGTLFAMCAFIGCIFVCVCVRVSLHYIYIYTP